MGRWVDDAMDVDEADVSEEIRELKVMHYIFLSYCVCYTYRDIRFSGSTKASQEPSVINRAFPLCALAFLLKIVPGYTTLVVDTNILLCSIHDCFAYLQLPLDSD